MQKYLDYHILDKYCIRVLYILEYTKNVDKLIMNLSNHEMPHIIQCQKNLMVCANFFDANKYIKHANRCRWSLPEYRNILVYKDRHSNDSINWLTDTKVRHIADHFPKFVINCVPRPFVGDNRFISTNLILCRFLPTKFKKNIIREKIPLYYNLPNTNQKMIFINNLIYRLYSFNKLEIIQVLKIIRVKTQKGQNRASIDKIVLSIKEAGLSIGLLGDLEKYKLISVSPQLTYNITSRGYVLLKIHSCEYNSDLSYSVSDSSSSK